MEKIHAPDDQHIVRAAKDRAHLDVGAFVGVFVVSIRDIVCPVAQQGHGFFGQRSENQHPGFPFRQGFAGFFIHNFWEKMVFPDVTAGALFIHIFLRNAGADDLAQAVNIGGPNLHSPLPCRWCLTG